MSSHSHTVTAVNGSRLPSKPIFVSLAILRANQFAGCPSFDAAKCEPDMVHFICDFACNIPSHPFSLTSVHANGAHFRGVNYSVCVSGQDLLLAARCVCLCACCIVGYVVPSVMPTASIHPSADWYLVHHVSLCVGV